jgi:predicted 2-oxoglutarate/Fe(II)-dependent dioxygenase YbiX
MSKRLQVLLDDEEMQEIKRLARQQRTSVAEWVRRALRSARQRQPGMNKEKKVQVVREAVRHSYPTADIEELLREIESGYLKD